MKFVKEINGEKVFLEETNKNLFSLLERNGFTEAEDELAELREKAKELGIKGYHNMKEENLIAKIAELE